MNQKILIIAFLVILSACSTSQLPVDSPENNDLKILSKQEFTSLFSSLATTNNGFDSIQTLSMAAESADTKSSYTTTNVQVKGIDEADIIKTDGEHIYAIARDKILIISTGPDAEIIAEIKPDITPADLFINDNQLVVIGTNNNFEIPYIIRRHSKKSSINVYDVSDKKNIVLEKELSFDGVYLQARLKNNQVYLITHTYNNIDYPVYTLENNIRPVDQVWSMPIVYDRPQLSTVYSINLNSYKVNSVGVVTESSPIVYVSENNIYLASNKRINTYNIRLDAIREVAFDQLPAEYKNLIRKIDSVDTDVLSDFEKKQKIAFIIEKWAYSLSEDEAKEFETQVTELYKQKLKEYEYLDFTHLVRIKYDNGNLLVQAHGKTPGFVNNQFSLDEHNNILRLATTTNPIWELDKNSTENHVFTLDNELRILDHEDNIAKDERIFSSRFIEDKLYLVTFRQVDPFFVIDLSNPKDIRVLGELKIPGFSRYLHPYDENIIIGVGRDADDTGRTQGVKVSLFDVSDNNNPKEITSYVIKSKFSSSNIEYDHHAFVLDKTRNLLIIPVRSDKKAGAYVFNITANSLELLGVVEHEAGVRFRYQAMVERSLIIDELLYTKSYKLLKINKIPSLELIKEIVLIDEKELYGPNY